MMINPFYRQQFFGLPLCFNMFFCSYIYSFFVVDLVHLLNKFPASDMGYEPAPDFQQSAKDPLVDLNLTDSSELWLIQWPLNQVLLSSHPSFMIYSQSTAC